VNHRKGQGEEHSETFYVFGTLHYGYLLATTHLIMVKQK